jgi:hypothetical protein
MTLNIFDAYGSVRPNVLETESDAVEALSDDHRQKLITCIKSVMTRDAGQDRILAARKDVREKEAIYNQAVMAFDQTSPSDNLQAEAKRSPKHAYNKDAMRAAAHKAVIAAQQPDYVAVKAAKPSKLKAAMDAANVALIDARAELSRASGELRTLERNAGEAIDAWRKCLTTPSAEQVAREYIAAGDAERVRRVAAGFSAEPKVAVSPNVSELDKVLGARGKTKTNRLPVYHGPK